MKALELCTITDKMYDIIVRHTGCGPFDGGCLLYATAAYEHFGGQLMVVSYKDIAQHACVQFGSKYFDANGLTSKSKIIESMAYEIHSQDYANFDIRPYKKGDLADCESPSVGVNELIKEFIHAGWV